jgi:hypothetical protein
MERVEQTVQPYEYPHNAHRRRHGPAGYSDYHSYKPWLEDEFFFRCVYCLKRVVWSPTDIWTIDHLIPQDEDPSLECDYENLVFACQFCNQQKGPNRVPDPCKLAYGSSLRVEMDGTITPLDNGGRRLDRVLRLNHKQHVEERRKIMRLIAVLAHHDQAEFERLMGFPSTLPDLEEKSPPSNYRPKGILESHLAKRRRGELPTVY